MKTIVNVIYGILLSICVTIFSPILIWYVFYRVGKVGMLLDYGRLGTFFGDIKVETKTDNVLWQGKSHEKPKAIRSMNVHSFWAKEDVVVIKVYRNDKKIAKLEKELASKGERK